MVEITPTRPEGVEALSPGHRPGLFCAQTCRPVGAKALKLVAIYKAFALTGRLADWHYTQGAALDYELLPFQGVLLVSITPLGYELLPFQGVLLVSITILGYALGPSARACPRAILVMFNFMSTKAFNSFNSLNSSSFAC